MKKERHSVLQKGTSALDKIVEALNKLTAIHRIMIFCGIFILLGGGFYYFAYAPKLTQISRLESRCSQLKKQLSTAKKKARNLKKYQEEMKEAQAQFNAAMEALPDRKEIPSLLTAVSQAGRDAGLDFLLFEPGAERNKQFYAEIPVQIEVTGSYHQTATFFDKVSRLSRVVNIDHIHINPGKNASQLKTSCVAVTYRFIEAPRENQKGKKKR
jgi:type IV pilus assembly protein PilO